MSAQVISNPNNTYSQELPMWVTALGLIIDMCGALLLVAPYYPKQVKIIIFIVFPQARYLESAKTKLRNHRELSLNTDKREMNVFYPRFSRYYGLDEELSNNPHIDEGYQISGIGLSTETIGFRFENNESIGMIKDNPLRAAERIIDRAIERYFVKIGAVLLFFGFSIQIAGVLFF